MRIENRKNEFPKMPDEMRAMVEREVEKQLKRNRAEAGRRTPARKMAVIGLAAAMALGTTVLAGTKIYRMYSEQVGSYGIRTRVGETDTPESVNTLADGEPEASGKGAAADAKLEIPDMKVKVNYLPQKMVQSEETKYHYETDTNLQGGFSYVVYAMDTGDDTFQILDTSVVSREAIQVADHDGIYLEIQRDATGSTWAKIYVFYPESHHVLEMMISPGLSREEAIKIAEGMELVELNEGETPDIGMNVAWSSYLGGREETEIETEFHEDGLVTEEEMKNTHSIGEAFPVTLYAENEKGEDLHTDSITVQVASVQVTDDLSPLNDSEYIDSAWLNAVDEDGKLLPDQVCYIKSGNGIDTLDEIIKTEQIAQKLVFTTVNYTNTGDQTLKNVLVNNGLIPICKNGDGYAIYDRDAGKADTAWDKVESTGVAWCGEMQFFDWRTDYGNGGNFIETIAPGETVSLHMAWIVDEDQLEYLYMAVNCSPYEITQEGLKTGYVDIRQ